MHGGWTALVWRCTACLCLSLLGITAVRSALVQAWVEDRPAAALAAWPGHPAAQIAAALSEIGAAAAQGRVPSSAPLKRSREAALKAPLAAEPFLLAGTEALSGRHMDRAKPLLLEARRRDPRSAATRVLLAQAHLQGGDTSAALEEIAALTRLTPGEPTAVVQTLAAYARQPGTEGSVKALFTRRPDLRDPVLTLLAADPRLEGRIMALAGPRGGAERWPAILIGALVADGQFRRARELWTMAAGLRTARPDGLVDPGFESLTLPAPFGWTLGSRTGLAEAIGRGQLRATAFGRDEGVVAAQMLTLPGGRYRLSLQVREGSGDPESLSWTVTCLPGLRILLRLPGQTSIGPIASEFEVPAGCPAQQLELVTSPNEFGRPATRTFDSLMLRRLTS